MTGDRPYYDFISVAANNAALEEAALKADAEANRLDKLAGKHSALVLVEGMKGGARAARRIAHSIRKLKISEEEG